MHRHRAKTTSDPRPYSGPVRNPDETRHEPRAHGGCSYIDTCSCGATRRINASAGFREVGEWSGRDDA